MKPIYVQLVIVVRIPFIVTIEEAHLATVESFYEEQTHLPNTHFDVHDDGSKSTILGTHISYYQGTFLMMISFAQGGIC